eukprot:5345171-Pyramimonas_sp.AAC.1
MAMCVSLAPLISILLEPSSSAWGASPAVLKPSLASWRTLGPSRKPPGPSGERPRALRKPPEGPRGAQWAPRGEGGVWEKWAASGPRGLVAGSAW